MVRFSTRSLLTRLMLLVLTAGTIGWLVLTGAYWAYMRQARDFAAAEYGDVVLPWRWDEFRRKRGEHYLAMAGQKLAQRDGQGAVQYFRAGLSLAPAHADGRLRLAALFHAANRLDLAADTLLAGLTHLSAEADYAKIVLQYLLDVGDSPKAEQVGNALLSSGPLPARQKAGLAPLVARAMLQLGHYEAMERLLAQHCHESDPVVVWLRARANLELGYPELARHELESSVAAGATFGPIFEALAAACRARGEIERERLLLVQALNAAPLAYQSHLALLRFQLGDPRAGPLDEEVAKYLRLFGRDETAVLALADLAATNGRPDLATMTLASVRTQPAFARLPFLLLEAEAHLSAGQYSLCLQRLDALAQLEIPDRSGPVISGLRAVALFGSNQFEKGRHHLGELLTGKHASAGNLLAVATKLSALGHFQPARELLARAHRDDPRNQRALTELLELELATGLTPGFPTLVQAYLGLAKPSPALLPRLHRTLARDQYLLSPEQPRLLAALDQADKAIRRGRQRRTAASSRSRRSFCSGVPTVTRNHSGRP